MNLEFSIKNQTLKRNESLTVVNKSKNIVKCLFTFEDPSDEDNIWDNINKFVIFKDSWGNDITLFLGKTIDTLSVVVPDTILQGTYFTLTVYGGDLITTNYVTVPLKQSGYNHHHGDGSCYHEHKDIFTDIFDRLDETVEDISFSNGCLHIYKDHKLVESVCLDFANETSVREWMQEYSDRFNSLLETKVNHSDLSDVAFSGDYNDLANRPPEFSPSHNHISSDIIDLNNTIDVDIETLLDTLVEDINKI